MAETLQSILDTLRKQKYADARTTVFSVQARAAKGVAHLTGEVLTSEQRAEAEQAIGRSRPKLRIINEVAVLSRPDGPWATVGRGLANLRRAPENGSELLAQGLFGEPIELLKPDAEKEWWFVRIADGYLGWMQASLLYVCDRAEAQAYRASADALVVAEQAMAYSTLLVSGGDEPHGVRALRLPFGAPVRVAERRMGMARVNWEGEPPLWVLEEDLLPMSRRPRPDASGMAYTLDLMGRFIGVPYLWGGETPFGYDCSGFAQTAMEFMGISVPRDADLQFMAGQAVEGEPQPGDLLFFSNNVTTGLHAVTPRQASITHVAISLGGDELIHAAGQVWSVTRNSLGPASPIYRAWLKEHLVGVRRFV
jgi:hypothetical protein